MTKQELKFFIKKMRRNKNSLLIGLLSGFLLAFFTVMLFFGISRVKLCDILRCHDNYQQSQITASVEIDISSESAKLIDNDLNISLTPSPHLKSKPTIEDQELEVINAPSNNFVLRSNHQYRIQDGDCLWNIAKNELGSGYRWVEIYQLNIDIIGDNPDLIYPNVILQLPQR